MKTLPLSAAKSQFSGLVEEVWSLEEQVVITRNGRPSCPAYQHGRVRALGGNHRGAPRCGTDEGDPGRIAGAEITQGATVCARRITGLNGLECRRQAIGPIQSACRASKGGQGFTL